MRTTRFSCDEAEERAAEHALGVLDGEDRAAMIAHLENCARCRATVNELVEVADLTLLLGPGAEPPADFEQRVLDAIEEPTPITAAPRAEGRTRSRSRRPVLLAAAVVALVALLSAGAVLALRRGDSTTTFAFRDVAGAEVGRATIKDGSPASVYMTVDRDISYAGCEVVLDNGQIIRLGDYSSGGDRADWWGRLPAPPDDVREVRLVDGSGQVVATADVS